MCVARPHTPLPYSIGAVRCLGVMGKLRSANKTLTADALKAEWEAVVAVREEAGRAVGRTFVRLFRAQERAVLERLDEALSRAGVAKADPFLIDWLLDRMRWGDWIDAEFEPVLRRVLRAGHRAGQLRINARLPAWNETAESVRVIAEVLSNLRETTETTATRLGNLVERSLREEKTRAEIRAEIRSTFSDWRETRADQAGMTAATGAFEEGQHEAWVEAGVTHRRWLSQRDDLVRPEHWDADGQEVGVDSPFVVGSDFLMYPGDPSADISMTANCRCATLPTQMGAESAVRSGLDNRDAQIRQLYTAYKAEELTFEQARLRLADEFALSERQVRRIVYEGSRS